MALIRKKSVNVLKHLQKLADDLDEIASLEDADINKAKNKIESINQEIANHQKEHDLATLVASNIKALLGQE